jgi:hypothetical protein
MLIAKITYPESYYVNNIGLYVVYYYHGFVNLFTILVSLDTYNEFKEF